MLSSTLNRFWQGRGWKDVEDVRRAYERGKKRFAPMTLRALEDLPLTVPGTRPPPSAAEERLREAFGDRFRGRFSPEPEFGVTFIWIPDAPAVE